MHRLFIYDFDNAQMAQSGDEIIYFSRQSDDLFITKELIKLVIYQNKSYNQPSFFGWPN